MNAGNMLLIGILALYAGIAVLLGIPQAANASSELKGSDIMSVEVTILSVAMMDITPDNMSFETMNPGETKSTYVSDDLGGAAKQGFQIENVGSVNITHVWLNVTQPASDPFGTGDPLAYDAANFIAMKINVTRDANISGTGINNPSNNVYSFVDHIEYNATTEIVYLNLPSDTLSYGRLRTGMNEYFWALRGSTCSAGNLEFRIGKDAHNKTTTGTINLMDLSQIINLSSFSDSGAYPAWLSADSNLSMTTGNGGDEEYLVLAARPACDRVRFVRWNADVPGAGTISNKGYVFDSESAGGALSSADSIAMDIQMRLPWGTMKGALKKGYLTVFANAV